MSLMQNAFRPWDLERGGKDAEETVGREGVGVGGCQSTTGCARQWTPWSECKEVDVDARLNSVNLSSLENSTGGD